MPMYNHISVAVPALDEMVAMPKLIDCLRKQSFDRFALYVCVNNPDDWWNDSGKVAVARANMALMDYLNAIDDMDVAVIDCCSKGKGWVGKRRGVGWARKMLFDRIVAERGSHELVVSMDADTVFGANYLQSVIDAMNADTSLSALAVPYYHQLEGGDDECRAILRYEIYMRYYLLQLIRIGSPYAFTALGSAMVFSAKAYGSVGGITPLQGGEDFYLMQKFVKTGKVSIYNSDCVYPSARVSNRVPFGTGPAVCKPLVEQERSYPFYPTAVFDRVGRTFAAFDGLYTADSDTPMTDFLQQQLKTSNLWQPLRANYKRKELFVRACAERVDGLRILQYLKQQSARYYSAERSSTPHLIDYCRLEGIEIDDDFTFHTAPIATINRLRDDLFDREMLLRKNKG